METTVNCPCCQNPSLVIEVPKGGRVVTTGRKLSDYKLPPILCPVCKKKIKYDILSQEE